MVLDCVVQREVVSHLQVGFGIMLKDRKIGPEVGMDVGEVWQAALSPVLWLYSPRKLASCML